MTSPPDVIRTERVGDEDKIFVITIDRVERSNAFDSATARAMEAAIDEFESDDSLAVAIVTGAGPTFSAGQDLKAAALGDFATTERRGGFGVMALRPSKPLIAAVEGDALAGGLELCLACDLIVATTTTRMGLPEAARALVAIGGGLFRLPQRIPFNVAMELALTGKPLPATDFHRMGLVNRITEPGGALAEALTLAGDIAAAGPLAVRASKQIAQHSFEWSDEQAWTEQMTYARPVLTSDDTQEGLRAFAEKRAPVWKGR
ncbi:crotonase/enoyl-CoA hydratase family protein [Hoyosella subflava]|uniref:Enoyl-CoA hydratase/isomerase n=1 Tax=Hoyosella subflava (strain DSM 45089 / JCM 17490 / NBRC 109087 / DQS3-9A1) TaxID=443218 RepID=F6ELD8_HOYSD|nr:crotonase/enoyl-CoA hydratase family protein [Hoyosella subflava]AEF39230.1 Enoyl-CoA hydratase/isomerase [Hoyosella subflava DQS3-9A1]